MSAVGYVELVVVVLLGLAALLSGFVVLPRRRSLLVIAGRRRSAGRGFAVITGPTLRAPLLERVHRLPVAPLRVRVGSIAATVRRGDDPLTVAHALAASDAELVDIARIAIARAAHDVGADDARLRADAALRLSHHGLVLDRLETTLQDDGHGDDRNGDRDGRDGGDR